MFDNTVSLENGQDTKTVPAITASRKLAGPLLVAVFGIAPSEVTFGKRRFAATTAKQQQRLETVGSAFLIGYHIALRYKLAGIGRVIAQELPTELHGFAFEGAAMALALLDHITPWKRDRIPEFIFGCAANHIYMAHVGIGWALARLNVEQAVYPSMDPLLRWLVFDGFGFHQGYFHPNQYLWQCRRPLLAGYSLRVFDQGLGRSLWFAEGARVARITATILRFPAERQADIWSGIGLACAYAGGFTPESLLDLKSACGEHYLHLTQGVCFAAKARTLAGVVPSHTETACNALCGLRSGTAADITDIALVDLPNNGEAPAYEVWRSRIRRDLSQRNELIRGIANGANTAVSASVVCKQG